MEDQEKSSFHGCLSRFAYVSPPSSSSSSLPLPSHDQAASTPYSIEGDDLSSSTPPVTISQKGGRDSVHRRTKARSPQKRQKLDNGAHSHLSGIPDCVAEDLDVLFCGINPGNMSAVTGHHYANPTNHFWHCLHLSGFTPRLLLPSEDCTLPERYNLGLINLVDRPSTSEADLSSQEMVNSVPALLTKIARFRPRIACFTGKGIWLHVERALKDTDVAGYKIPGIGNDPVLGAQLAKTPKDERSAYFHFVGDHTARPEREESESDVSSKRNTSKISGVEEIADATPVPKRRAGVSSTPRPASKKAKAPPARAFAYGLQPLKAVHNTVVPHSASVGETLFCVFPSTSGRVVSHQRDDKTALFKALRENLGRLKAGTLDTGSMRIICLRTDGH